MRTSGTKYIKNDRQKSINANEYTSYSKHIQLIKIAKSQSIKTNRPINLLLNNDSHS